MRTLSRLLSALLLIGLSFPAWADTDTSTTTLTIAPSATSGATITAADENDRSGDVTTWANAHVHTLPNTTNFGTGSAGNKALCADAADSTDACIRWNDTSNMWTLDNPTPGTYNQVATYSTTSGITPNAVVIGDGTGALLGVTHGTSGQYLQSAGSSASPTWVSAGNSNVFAFSRTAAAGSGTVTNAHGLGATPKQVTAYCTDDDVAFASWGIADANSDEMLLTMINAAVYADNTAQLINVGAGTADQMTAVLDSMDSTNLTITWTKAGSGREMDCVALVVQ